MLLENESLRESGRAAKSPTRVDQLAQAADRAPPVVQGALGAPADPAREELNDVDHPGALERFRLERLQAPRVLGLSNGLISYPFPERLYPRSLEAAAL